MRVLGRPDRLETALLKRAGKLRRRHRIIGKEHRAAEMHVPLLLLCPGPAAEVSPWRRPALSVTYLHHTRFTRTASSPGQRAGEGLGMGTAEGAERSPAAAVGCRKIIHIDMDAFYASVEQRDNPELRAKPVAVGGSRERGVVAAASYEARKFGVHSAMPSITAKRKCPDLIFVKPRFDAYKAISLQIREIFAAYTLIIEPLSLDEAYLDVTENLKGIGLATQIAEEIRARIRAEIELTASAGVSYNKFLAKLASDHRKPDRLFVITPKMGPAFVETLPVRKFHGVGPATARKMARLGIENGLDLKGQNEGFLARH